jgi:hypothetical protein
VRDRGTEARDDDDVQALFAQTGPGEHDKIVVRRHMCERLGSDQSSCANLFPAEQSFQLDIFNWVEIQVSVAGRQQCGAARLNRLPPIWRRQSR